MAASRSPIEPSEIIGLQSLAGSGNAGLTATAVTSITSRPEPVIKSAPAPGGMA